MSEEFIRRPRFAGSWYPATLEEAESYWKPARERKPARAVVCPHAGWIYSGRVAGDVYGQVQPPDTFVVIGPNHTGRGRAGTSLWSRGAWLLPQNRMPVDEPLAADLLRQSEFLAEDPEAHTYEHSIEVQLPFLLLMNPEAKLVPVIMRDYDTEIYADLGRSIAAACRKRSGSRVLIVASSDMTHYEPHTLAARKDQAAIERMAAVDPDGLRDIVENLGITMCGWGPAAAALYAARQLGAEKGRLVRYATSGDVTGDRDSVVGYAGVIID